MQSENSAAPLGSLFNVSQRRAVVLELALVQLQIVLELRQTCLDLTLAFGHAWCHEQLRTLLLVSAGFRICVPVLTRPTSICSDSALMELISFAALLTRERRL
jgi:hypothetical protein